MTELAREYGDGLYALAMEEKIAGDVLSQLQTLKAAFREEPDFLRLLGNMSLSREERLGILDRTFRGQVHPYVLNFLKILCERGALGEFAGCEEAYRQRYNQDHQVVEAVVTTAQPMTSVQRAQLLQKLQHMTGKQVSMTEKLDASVMGGVLLEMNGQRYDNTVRHRLAAIHQAMVGQN